MKSAYERRKTTAVHDRVYFGSFCARRFQSTINCISCIKHIDELCSWRQHLKSLRQPCMQVHNSIESMGLVDHRHIRHLVEDTSDCLSHPENATSNSKNNLQQIEVEAVEILRIR